jgi:membrane protease YdiL (CAAX protease family)
LLDIVVVAVVYLTGTILGRSVAAQAVGAAQTQPAQLTSHQWLALILGAGLGSLVGAALAIGWLKYAARATWADLGMTCPSWPSHVFAGLKTFLLLMLPIFGLQWALNLAYERFVDKPPQHPLIEHLLDYPTAAGFAIAAFTAVIVAPLTEEFLFRSVLQGWFERVFRRASASGCKTPLPPASCEGQSYGRSPLTPTLSPEGRGSDDTGSESSVGDGQNEEGFATPAPSRPLLIPPILLSSAIFAGMHYEHGVAWIPLFFFALALGCLYQRTGSLVAPIVLHMSLNASSMLMLWLFSLSQGAG